MKTCRVGPKMMPLPDVRRWEGQARRRGVSKVARSRRGFLTAYKNGELDADWCRKRTGFIKRHMAQVHRRGEKLWKNGVPSRRTLALMMWAYRP